MNPEPSFPSAIAFIRDHSLTSLAQAEIEKLILSGAIQPGERLGEADMAERVGVSRGPIREAFRALEEQGLVRVEKNRGVFVRKITTDEADETYTVRMALEALAGRILAERITDAEIGTLRHLLSAMESACHKGNAKRYSELNLRFHGTLIELTGNTKLRGIYNRLVKTLSLFRAVTLFRSDTLSVSLEEHRRIVEAIASRNGDAASEAMSAHVEASRHRMHATQGV